MNGRAMQRFAVIGLVACLVAAPARADAPSFHEWLKGFRAEAAAAGLREDVIDRAFDGVNVMPRVLELNEDQPEFAR
ncbi:MAG: lytic murein transglycosylase, partial [Amphiplicatus sp.]